MDIIRLKNKGEFAKTKKSKNKFFGEGIFLQATKRNNQTEHLGIGFVVTSKQGNAVKRNRIRRRVSEAIRTLNKKNELAEKLQGYDMVVIPNSKILGMEWEKLVEQVRAGMDAIANWTPNVQNQSVDEGRREDNG